MSLEIPIRSTEIRKLLCCGCSRVSAIKSAMGIKGRRFVFMSHVAKFLADNPGFQEQDVYKKKAKA
jgi:hypothetical protein